MTFRRCLGGSVGYASAFTSGHDPSVLGSSPASRGRGGESLLSRELTVGLPQGPEIMT